MPKELIIDVKTGERRWEEFPAVEPQANPELLALRAEYLSLTRTLCGLAGRDFLGKLTNLEYKEVANAAAHLPQAGVVTASLVYCRTCLREIDGEQWWDNL